MVFCLHGANFSRTEKRAHEKKLSACASYEHHYLACALIMWHCDVTDEPTTTEEKSKVNRINDFWKPFYFRWVETFLEKGSGEDIVPLKHFLHRFTRSVFWELEDMIPL